MVNLKNFFSSQTKLFRFEQLHETLTIYQLNRDDAITVCFFLGVRAEPTCRDKNAFIRSAHDCISKITNLRTTD